MATTRATAIANATEIVTALSWTKTANGRGCSVQLLTKYYQLDFLKPILHSLPLTVGSVATVPIFDAKALLIAFLNDPLRMCQENFASNYDIFTEKGKLPTSTLDEIHTGSLWEQASQNTVVMIQMHFP